jgi:hypothetical protein
MAKIGGEKFGSRFIPVILSQALIKALRSCDHAVIKIKTRPQYVRAGFCLRPINNQLADILKGKLS